jgi:hypothetical protein
MGPRVPCPNKKRETRKSSESGKTSSHELTKPAAIKGALITKARCPHPGGPILPRIHYPPPLSHIGTSPPQAYPQITPPPPLGVPEIRPENHANPPLQRFPQHK